MLSVAPPLRVVVYRRLMMRIAEQIARRHRAGALVTGEVVGQVASQTIENMSAINEVVTLPVLRPLVGMDKEEITSEAQRLGTYPISIIPDQDCCTLFTPKHPATRARRHDVARAESALDIERIVEEAVNAAAIEHFAFPVQNGFHFMALRLPPGVHHSAACHSASSKEKTVKFTPGKLAGMKAVSDKRGVIAAAAMDQRGSLQKALAKDKGGDVGDRDIEEFKALVTEVLTPHASAILLDPEWGIPASKRRAKNAGLLMAYEKTGYDKTGAGRLPDLLDNWSVRRLKEIGTDCIKILLYYTPFDPKDVNDIKHAWVERIGDECRANDIPFFLEFVGYEEGVDEKGPEYSQEEAGGRHRQHGGVHQGSLRRRRDEGRSADQHEVRRGQPVVRRHQAVLEAGGDGLLPPLRRGRDQAVHLPLSRRQQPGVHRVPGARRRSRHALLGRAVRPRHVEGRHRRLRQERRRRVPDLAAGSGREEHRQRQSITCSPRTRGSSSTAPRARTSSHKKRARTSSHKEESSDELA